MPRAEGRLLFPVLDGVARAAGFCEFAKEVPGMFFFLGIVKAGTTSGPNHTANFLADDSAIPVGIRAISAMVMDYTKPQGSKPY